ncbi:qaraquat-inducible protein B [Hoeflea sp. IMCC20628]|uniref:PqiB family protein n=1 Tax=Hoeflea sp. IMCC20628 TaxID=1620421 RepID=UPI00063AFD7F|nr:MlaD family protein [Hoeflea sp. IMCC20628]AKI02577.1 qaraquat-inducible protein B [Hoeflea sp. IMCC20628]
MNDIDTPASGRPGDVPVKPGKKTFWDSASLIWAIPVIALGIALAAAWQSYNQRGPLIEISFTEAAGIKAQETQLRYRDLSVGKVEQIRFSDNLEKVVVSIRIEKDLARYIDADAKFWVVRPEVSARGVSGLDTVLSGVYIQGVWDNVIASPRATFEGLADAPLIGLGREGITFKLRSTKGLPGAGTPILYKDVEVGAIGETSFNKDGTGVIADAVIYEPMTGFVTTSTRFWDISGFSFSLGATGAKVNFNSLASLISGGVTFETIGSGGEPLTEGTVYDLFKSEDEARDEFLIEDEGKAVDVAMVFDQNLPGLSTGAAVELGGLRVGDVTGINGLVDKERFGDSYVRLIASVRLNPGRLGLGEGAGEDALLDYLEDRTKDGLRARLVNASLFTGGLKIELADLPDAKPATLDRAATPLPTIPTAPADVADVGATAQGVLQRVSDLPIEELMQSVIAFLGNATALVGSKELQAAPAELTGLLAAVRTVAESQRVQGMPEQIGGLLDELKTTSATLNRLMRELETQKTIERLTETVDAVATAADGLPQLVEEARGILKNAGEVPLNELADRAANLLEAANLLLDQDSTRQLPAELNGALAAMRQTLDELQNGGLVDNANATLSSAREAADAIAEASATLPQLAGELRKVAGQAGVTLQAYSGDSEFSRDTRGAINKIDAAARAIESLARAIERNPNSLLLGR